MLIGILADSHGRDQRVRRAMTLFDRLGVEHVFHCGDVGGSEVFDQLVGRQCTFVWGNMDFPDDGLCAYLESVGINAPACVPTQRTVGGKRFAVFHGHEPGFDAAVSSLDVDYILHGHTHIARDERLGGKRVINPGALHRAKEKTVATLDTQSDTLAFHVVE